MCSTWIFSLSILIWKEYLEYFYWIYADIIIAWDPDSAKQRYKNVTQNVLDKWNDVFHCTRVNLGLSYPQIIVPWHDFCLVELAVEYPAAADTRTTEALPQVLHNVKESCLI